MKTHIRLDVSIRDEVFAILVPIEGTTFEITPGYETVAIVSSGRRYVIEQNFQDIETALDAVRVGTDHV